jgi:uncharacterized phiE125 gp8 family phage protein
MDFRPSYKLITPSGIPPVTYDEAAEHLRVDSDDDEVYIGQLLAAAQEYVEGITGRATLSATYRLTAPDWDSITTERSGAHIITLDRAPLISVATVKHIIEGASTLTTMSSANYAVMTTFDPGGIFFASTYTFPTLNAERPDAVQIDFVAGYAAVESSSQLVRHAIKILVAHWYENRLPVAAVNLTPIPMTLRDIIHNQRMGGMFA